MHCIYGKCFGGSTDKASTDILRNIAIRVKCSDVFGKSSVLSSGIFDYGFLVDELDFFSFLFHSILYQLRQKQLTNN